MAYLLDTYALIWSAAGEKMRAEAMEDLSCADAAIFVSPVSYWEIGVLVAKGRIAFSVDDWLTMIKPDDDMIVALSPEIMVSASALPGAPPNDFADRLIIATARAKNMCLVTRNKAMLDYAAQGHVQCLEC